MKEHALAPVARAIDRLQRSRRRGHQFLSRPYTYIGGPLPGCPACSTPPERIRVGHPDEVVSFAASPVPVIFQPCGHLFQVTQDDAEALADQQDSGRRCPRCDCPDGHSQCDHCKVCPHADRQLSTEDPRVRLAQFFEGEEPYTDERVIPTPAQWIWKWNRATPARRLQIAEAVLGAWDVNQKCLLDDHLGAIEELHEARAAIYRVRQLHRPVDHYGVTICAECSGWDGSTTDSSPCGYEHCPTIKALSPPETP
ncbi:hypothetical protein [Streptomyces liliifuscus]|uniref:Uncharacterized protein n=1 Tax=Streptomyces liliifuscus TaxID=2797636 RepID=A0A7T7L2N8_9ACTN|nr:hypothetical protein [Streptomyces liliifuscus]QQM45221.1 hypothetical protein JEQ17_41320 [Streptomyces liliifuscus]